MSRFHFLTQLFAGPSAGNLVILAGLLLVLLAVAYLTSKLEPTVIVVVAIVLQLFSGNWPLFIGVDIPLDRLALVLAIASLILKGSRAVSNRRLVVRPLHLVMLSALAWTAASAVLVGTLFQHLGFYAYLDRFGLVPFALFFLAPYFFGSSRHRNMLLGAGLGIGLYLGLTGIEEGLHLYGLLFPRYIANPNVGIHWGRARGPLLEATGDGFCIFVGGVCAALGLSVWKRTWVRALCVLSLVLDAGAVFFTLTRGVWIGAAVGAIVGMAALPRTRRLIAPMVVSGLMVVSITLAASSSIRAEVLGRTESVQPVWDRENTDLAALRIVLDKPLTGVGWENFPNVAGQYMKQQATYPITGLGLEVHNVYLSHAAELGLPGLVLWASSFLGAFWRAVRPRWPRAPGQSASDAAEEAAANTWRPTWQAGGLAIGACFLCIASFSPFSQALPNSLLWTFLGVMAVPYTSALRPGRALVGARRSPDVPEDGYVTLVEAPVPVA